MEYRRSKESRFEMLNLFISYELEYMLVSFNSMSDNDFNITCNYIKDLYLADQIGYSINKHVVAVLRYLKENTIDGLLKVNHYEFLRKKVLYND